MKRNNLYFINKIVGCAIVVAVIVCCNLFLADFNRKKAEAIAATRQMVEESKAAMEAELAEALSAIPGYGSIDMQEAADSVPAKYIDGIYDGEAEGYGGLIQVEVTVMNGEISAIDILYAGKEDEAYMDMAVGVIDDMIAENEPEVDAVTGSTFSSKGIVNAAKNALEAAINEQ